MEVRSTVHTSHSFQKIAMMNIPEKNILGKVFARHQIVANYLRNFEWDRLNARYLRRRQGTKDGSFACSSLNQQKSVIIHPIAQPAKRFSANHPAYQILGKYWNENTNGATIRVRYCIWLYHKLRLNGELVRSANQKARIVAPEYQKMTRTGTNDGKTYNGYINNVIVTVLGI